jgi:hypothetical protein
MRRYLKSGDTSAGKQLVASALQKNPDLAKTESNWQDAVLAGH